MHEERPHSWLVQCSRVGGSQPSPDKGDGSAQWHGVLCWVQRGSASTYASCAFDTDVAKPSPAAHISTHCLKQSGLPQQPQAGLSAGCIMIHHHAPTQVPPRSQTHGRLQTPDSQPNAPTCLQTPEAAAAVCCSCCCPSRCSSHQRPLIHSRCRCQLRLCGCQNWASTRPEGSRKRSAAALEWSQGAFCGGGCHSAAAQAGTGCRAAG